MRPVPVGFSLDVAQKPIEVIGNGLGEGVLEKIAQILADSGPQLPVPETLLAESGPYLLLGEAAVGIGHLAPETRGGILRSTLVRVMTGFVVPRWIGLVHDVGAPALTPITQRRAPPTVRPRRINC